MERKTSRRTTGSKKPLGSVVVPPTIPAAAESLAAGSKVTTAAPDTAAAPMAPAAAPPKSTQTPAAAPPPVPAPVKVDTSREDKSREQLRKLRDAKQRRKSTSKISDGAASSGSNKAGDGAASSGSNKAGAGTGIQDPSQGPGMVQSAKTVRHPADMEFSKAKLRAKAAAEQATIDTGKDYYDSTNNKAGTFEVFGDKNANITTDPTLFTGRGRYTYPDGGMYCRQAPHMYSVVRIDDTFGLGVPFLWLGGTDFGVSPVTGSATGCARAHN